jgi:membrane protease YdiL (CAAX protease family)
MTGNPPSHGELEFILAASWCAIGFASYYFLSHSQQLAGRIGILIKRFDSQGNKIVLQRMLGVLFLGIISSLIILALPGVGLQNYGLGFSFIASPPWWSYLLIPLILGLGVLAARKPGNLALYPQIRLKQWTPSLLFISAITWIAFLIGYEFLFRGFLLHASLAIMPPLPAFALNCALYALAHMYKGPRETFGAIPVGIVLCYLTLITGNIWSAVILHSAMALSNEWFSIQAHPDMKISKSIT